MTFVVETAASGSTGHLGVLGAREKLTTRVGVLREALERDGTRRHVHAESQRLRGENHGEQVAFETGLDDLTESGHHSGVVHRDATSKRVNEVGVFERLEVLGREVD